VCVGQICLTGLLPVCLSGSPFEICKAGGECAATEAPTTTTVVDVTDARSTFAPTEDARACASHEWTCRSKECIRATLRCDDYLDCADGSDELACVAATPAAYANIDSKDNTASSEKSALAVVGTMVVLLVLGIAGFMIYRNVNDSAGPMARTVNLSRAHSSSVELKTMTSNNL
jgi:hypothetical protein